MEYGDLRGPNPEPGNINAVDGRQTVAVSDPGGVDWPSAAIGAAVAAALALLSSAALRMRRTARA